MIQVKKSNIPLKVQIPDDNYWKEQIKCQYACPVHTDARGYVRAIADGDFEKAYLIARAPNPLASICGRVCGAPCEAACRRGSIDKSIFIRGLKRTAYENCESDVKALSIINKIKELSSSRQCVDIEDVGVMLENIESGKLKKASGESVGIIGSGPAGLAVAHDLAILGFSPVIYEADPKPAGMLYAGVPAYRLPRELLEAEIDVIKSLGVEIITNCTIGRDITFSEIREKHDVTVIAVGCKKSKTIPIPGADAKGVIGGVELLNDIAFDRPRDIGKRVVIIGGGNVANDIARSALRQQQIDIAEGALHSGKDVKVSLVCLEAEREMLADEVEILEAAEEGIKRHNAYGPQEITVKDGAVSGVIFHKVISIFDENGRFSPRFDQNDVLTIEADTVLFGIGQSSDLSFIDSEKDGIEMNERGLFVMDSVTNKTSAEDVYLAGDLATGPKLMIDAIASGKKTARSIYGSIMGRRITTKTVTEHSPIYDYGRELGYEKIQRAESELVEATKRRMSLHQISEKGLTCQQAKVEGSRCFDCGINTIFDGNRCILCGGCVDVCPEVCLKLVPVSDLDGNKDFDDLVNLNAREKKIDTMSAIIMDNEKCIRCGLCAVRCPTDAITMEKFSFKEQLV